MVGRWVNAVVPWRHSRQATGTKQAMGGPTTEEARDRVRCLRFRAEAVRDRRPPSVEAFNTSWLLDKVVKRLKSKKIKSPIMATTTIDIKTHTRARTQSTHLLCRANDGALFGINGVGVIPVPDIAITAVTL